MSQLKKCVGATVIVLPTLPSVDDDSAILPQPEAILDQRVTKKGHYRLKEEVLVKWLGVLVEDATWENKWHFS